MKGKLKQLMWSSDLLKAKKELSDSSVSFQNQGGAAWAAVENANVKAARTNNMKNCSLRRNILMLPVLTILQSSFGKILVLVYTSVDSGLVQLLLQLSSF